MSSNSNEVAYERPPQDWVAKLFAQLEGPLVAYVRPRVGGDVEQAQDVVQESFVKLCQQRWPQIEENATAWLYKTCRNRAIDIIRREGRMGAVSSSMDVSTITDPAERGPETRTEQLEEIDRMKLQIKDLPDRQQEILRLRLHDGLSYKQIAEVTGLTATNVGYLLHQAIAKLRIHMTAPDGMPSK